MIEYGKQLVETANNPMIEKTERSSLMAENAFEEGRRYAEFMKSLSDEQRNEISRKNIDSSLKEHEEFKNAYRTGRCYVCHKKFASFDRNQPCFHWFLRPHGATKNDIKLVAEKYGFFRVQHT